MATLTASGYTLTGMVVGRCACCREQEVLTAPDNMLNTHCPDCDEMVMECCVEAMEEHSRKAFSR